MRYILFFSLIFLIGFVKAQDAIYSQLYNEPSQVNPAFAGLSASPVFKVSYRNQWPNIPQAFNTFSASYQQLIPAINCGIGLRLQGDIMGAGIYSNYSAHLLFNYDIRFSEDFYLKAGFDVGAISYRIQWDELVFMDQIELQTYSLSTNGNIGPTAEATGFSDRTIFDVGAGLLFHSPFLYAGISAKHLGASAESAYLSSTSGEAVLPIAIHAVLGTELTLGKRGRMRKKATLSPFVSYTTQGSFNRLSIGSNLAYKIILAGMSFQHNFINPDALTLMIGIQKGIYRFCYAYDIGLSALSMMGGGAHEFTFSLNFGKNKTKQTNYNDCLNMFR